MTKTDVNKNSITSVVWLGDFGFPVGLATIQKTFLMCKCLENVGVQTLIINRFGIHNRGIQNLKTSGIYQGIRYIYTSGNPYRSDSFIKRNYLKIKGLVKEVVLLFDLKNKRNLDAAILRTSKFTSILFYRIISKILGVPLVLLYHELYSTIDEKQEGFAKIDSYLYERFGFDFIDGIWPISDYLMDFVNQQAPTKPLLKIPIIADFSKFEIEKKTHGSEYFLYCGGAAYIEVIKFILKSYSLQKCNNTIWLYLIVNGDEAQLNEIYSVIETLPQKKYVKVFSNLPEGQLIELYCNAKALLIPLRPTLQDRARFPHKIGEYMATGNPLITTNYGEVKNYFRDCENAVVASEYNVKKFAEKMDFVVKYPEKAKRIGLAGRALGYDLFDYNKFGHPIKDFLSKL